MTDDQTAKPAFFTARFQTALHCADLWHRGQTRKSTSIPYLSHLLGVASLALEFRTSEDEAIAALLHDALEDGPDNTECMPADLGVEIANLFGDPVTPLVDAATNDTPLPNQPESGWSMHKRTDPASEFGSVVWRRHQVPLVDRTPSVIEAPRPIGSRP